MQDEVHARLRRAAAQLREEAMAYQPPSSFGADYVRIRYIAEELYREGIVPGSEETLAAFDDALRERVATCSGSAFGFGVLVGLAAAGSS